MSNGIPFTVFLISAAIIITVFVIVARSTALVHDVDYGRANGLRKMFGTTLVTILLIFLVMPLPRMPYPAEASTAERIVYVVGKQYEFSLTTDDAPTLATWSRVASPTVEVPARATVEFRVTTRTVSMFSGRCSHGARTARLGLRAAARAGRGQHHGDRWNVALGAGRARSDK